MSKFSDYLYESEFRLFSKRRKAAATSSRGVLNHKKTIFFIVALLAIPVIHWIIFWLFINFQSIILAFQDPLTGKFTFDNFKIFWGDLTNPTSTNVLGLALKNTFLYFGSSVFIVLPISLFIAYFLYKKIPGYKFFRIIFFIPAIISGTALVTAFSVAINPGGFFAELLDALGIHTSVHGLLGTKETATYTILFYTIMTSFTTNVLLFQGAMTRVPGEVLESAKLEGCSPFREVIEIIFPLIWPTFATQLIFTMTGLFTASGPILLFDPENTVETMTISYWIFSKSLMGSDYYNIVSCTGLCFTIAGFPIIMLVRNLTDKIKAVEY